METSLSPHKDEEVTAENVSPLRPERVGILQHKYDQVRTLARQADRIVATVVRQYSLELDEFFAAVEVILRRLKEDRGALTQDELQRMVLKLPVLQYRMVDGVDMAAIESDVAKIAAKLVNISYFKVASGPVKDRELTADMQAAEEDTVVDLAKHVHSRLRARMDVANNLFDAVRKVMSSRDVEKQTFRKDQS